MRKNHNDSWVKLALKNREPDIPYSRQQLICEQGSRQEVVYQKVVDKPEKGKSVIDKKLESLGLAPAGLAPVGLGPTGIGPTGIPDPKTAVMGHVRPEPPEVLPDKPEVYQQNRNQDQKLYKKKRNHRKFVILILTEVQLLRDFTTNHWVYPGSLSVQI